VRISPYSQFNDQSTFTELIGRMRHSLFNVPKDHFASTLANMIELQQPNLAAKLATILLEHPSFPAQVTTEFKSHEERILIFWSLM
jgi:hypothetical protein